MKLWIAHLAVIGTSFAGTIYSITDLGGLGGTSAAAFSINSTGVTAGWAYTPLGYTAGLVAVGGKLQALALGSEAFGINDAGQVVGQLGNHGALWTATGMTDLGADTAAMAINNTGQIAGGNGHAILIGGGATRDLGTLGGGSWSAAYGLNDTGEVVGSAMLANGHFEGFTWSLQTGMVGLGSLGGKDSHATAVNALGQVTGSASLSNGYQHAVLYSNGRTVDLGSLGTSNSYGYAINNSGIVVGYSYVDGQADSHAFVYAGGMMVDLNLVIPVNSGWELLAAYGINEAGQIVGSGIYEGQSAMFLLDRVAPSTKPLSPFWSKNASALATSVATPEPATGGLLVIGTALFIIFRRHLSSAVSVLQRK